MKQFIIRRLILSVFILFGVSLIIYTLVRMMPGDYVQNLTANNPNVTPEMVQRLRSLYGLDDGIVEGYIKWVGKAVQGNLGDSFIYQKPVTEVISSKIWNSFALAFTSYFFELLFAIPLGIFAATRQYSKLDYGVTVFGLIGISLPSFFFAAILKRIFSVGLKWVPLQGMVTARKDYEGFALFLDIAWHYILPIAVLTIIGIGSTMRYSRTNMLEVLNMDFVRTARAKGLSESKVIYKHAFRNTLIPIVTMIGNSLPGLFSGAIITEGIFAIDGIGNAAFVALAKGDIPFIMGFNIILAVLTLCGTLLADVLYAAVDPRVRLS